MNNFYRLIGLLILALANLVAHAQEAEFFENEELPYSVSGLLDDEKYGIQGAWWGKRVQLLNVNDKVETALVKSGPFSNFIVKDIRNEQLELNDFSGMITDSVGYFVLLGDSLEAGSKIKFLKPNLHVRELIVHGLSNCKLELVGNYEKITLIDCKDLVISNPYSKLNPNHDRLRIRDFIKLIHCELATDFDLSITEGGGKLQFEDCTFDLAHFQLTMPDTMRLVFANSPISGIQKFSPKWIKLSNWLIPKEFLFWNIRQIDSLGERYCSGYDDCLSAEDNKLAWTENFKIVLHQFQEHYRGNYEFEKGDSVFRTLKELETETYRCDLENPRSRNQFKSTIHYYFMSFMGWFCGYGTEPILALYNAMLLILGFALLYILFPTRYNDRVPLAEDGFFFLGLRIFSGEETEVDRLLSAYKEYLKINPNGTLWRFYQTRRKRLLATYKRKLPAGFAYMIEASASANRFTKMVLGIYLKAAALPYLANLLIVSLVEKRARMKLDAGTGKTTQRASFGRLLKGKNIAFLFGALILLLLARIPVGLLVSVNAFSTLGFGKLPLRGITKYLAILEGLVGWFTLTLFSITYVNILLR